MGAKMGCQGQACFNLMCVIVGHYVNCTSNFCNTHLSFNGECLESRVDIFFPILYLCGEGQLRILFFQHLSVCNSRSHIHTWKLPILLLFVTKNFHLSGACRTLLIYCLHPYFQKHLGVNLGTFQSQATVPRVHLLGFVRGF